MNQLLNVIYLAMSIPFSKNKCSSNFGQQLENGSISDILLLRFTIVTQYCDIIILQYHTHDFHYLQGSFGDILSNSVPFHLRVYNNFVYITYSE